MAINDDYFDAALRHQIDLRRYSAGLTKKLAKLLEDADRDLVAMLRDRLARFEGKPIDFTSERWMTLLEDIRAARTVVLKEYNALAQRDLIALGQIEADHEVEAFRDSITFDVNFATVAADQLKAIIKDKPFEGHLLKAWFKGLQQADADRLVRAVQLGMTNGETIDQLVRRVVGTRAAKYADGILATTRRNAQAIVRTAVNHVSNTAREYVWDANSDIITCLVVVATLDGRTTAVCRARDGHGTPIGANDLPPGMQPLIPPGVRPPFHMGCRTCMVAYLSGVGLLGNRPTVSDTRTRREREIDFRKMARESGKPIQEVRKDWADANVGTTPSKTTYQEFMARQTNAFQEEVLGKTKAKLFRDGGLPLDQFVDREGNELTLSQLAARKPGAFKAAGLDPAKF